MTRRSALRAVVPAITLPLLATLARLVAQDPPRPDSTGPLPQGVPARTSAEVAAAVDAIAARHLKRPGAVGLSIGVARRGEVIVDRGYGIADAEFDAPADAQTMFRIGSVTKQFTAALVMRCVERGALSLDDPMTKHLAAFPTGEHKVTVRQLLNHTSGIKSYTDVGEKWEKKQPLELTDDELLALVKDEPFDFEPGADWRYNNTGYYLLGMLLAKVHGKPYADVVRDEICAPLGLEHTRYDSNKELLKKRAQGYSFADGKLINDDPLGMSQPGAAGGLLSTGGDLVRWSMALSGGKVVGPDSIAAMTKSTVLPDGRDTHYGFGLGIGEFAGRPSIQHGGGIHGFNSMLMWLPELGLHVAVISNGERLGSTRVAEDILYEAFGLPRPVAKDLPLPKERLAAICGDYEIAALGMKLRLFEQDGAPMLQAEGQGAFRLLWQGEGEFRASFDPAVRVAFAADDRSFELHQGGGAFVAKRK